MRTVCNELEEVEYKAYEIGIQLGIRHSKMLVFKEDKNFLSNAINYWLCGNVPGAPVTWGYLVKALKSKQVGEIGHAEAIRLKYCHEEEESKDKGQ